MRKESKNKKQRNEEQESENVKKPNQEAEPEKGAEQPVEEQAMVGLTFEEYDDLEKQLASLAEDIEKEKDAKLRAMAEFENYKKRVKRDATRTYQDSMTTVLKIFLNVADDLERALKNKPTCEECASWINGIELIHQKLMNQLKNQGVERIKVKSGDEFDPNIHEAVTQEEHPEFEDGQIIDVIEPGYRISDRIIRPAMVRVAQ